MGGGLMQLVAYGAQDIYLTGNPQITFFKVVYRRHTNFSMETIEQTISGSAVCSTGNKGTVTISRNGDLLHKVYVTTTGDTQGTGDQIISDVEVQIGGQRIDKHTTEWLQLWAELTTPDSKAGGYVAMTGVAGSKTGSGGDGVFLTQIPLQFWFCRNPGLALPLIALQYHEVKLIFNWGNVNSVTAKVMADYIYLDTDERRRFAQTSHEYLIEQLQYVSGENKSSHKLTFNHPVKELIWTNDGDNLTTATAKLKLNGHDRFAAMEKEYFQLRHPYDYHTAVPGQNIPTLGAPVFLETPIDTEVETQNATVTATAAAMDEKATPDGTVTTVKFDSDTADIPKVGDVLLIYMSNEEVDAAAESVSSGGILATVTDRSTANDPVITFEPGIPNTQFPDGYTNADGLRILIIARKQAQLGRCSSLSNKINVYSFALEPEEHQPSGTCNFSRIDTAHLEFSSQTQLANIYAVNYNVLRIMSGMGGLAYSN